MQVGAIGLLVNNVQFILWLPTTTIHYVDKRREHGDT